MPKPKKTTGTEQDPGRKTGARAGRETVIITALATLLVGFVCGMAFQAYRTGAAGPAPGTVSTPAPAVPGESAEALHREMHELEEAAAANPESAEVWARLGNAYFGADRYEDAIRAYRRSLDIEPGNPGVWSDLGVMYRRSGNPREAVRAFDRAIEVDPTHEISRFNKGVVLLHDLEDLDGAIQAWEGLIEINPTATAPNGQPVMSLVEQFKRVQKQN